jgi:hypothetical protein
MPTTLRTSVSGPGPPSRLDRLGSIMVSFRLLLSSYAALDFILAARICHLPLRLAFGVLGVAGLVDGLRLIKAGGDRSQKTITFLEVRDSGGQVAAYLATYLLPLLAAPSPTAGDIVGYGIYAIVIAIVTIRSDLIHVNPTMYVLGWKIATVTRQDGKEQYAICKKTPPTLRPVGVRQFHGVARIENT